MRNSPTPLLLSALLPPSRLRPGRQARTAAWALLLPALVLGCGGAARGQEPERTPLVHLQSDRDLYRLGETLWFRAHLGEGVPLPLQVELRRQGQVLWSGTLADREQPQGKLLLEESWEGGAVELRVRSGETLLHVLPLELYAQERQPLRFRLRVLGEVFLPGEELSATVQVSDAKGSPLAGQQLRARATFGPLVVEEEVGPTDAQGWALVRLRVPPEARTHGHLAVGAARGDAVGAAAAEVRVSAGVGRIDFFPEGGAIVTGHAQRIALWARDLAGGDAVVEGRVRDDQGQVVASFASDAYGHALIDVPYLEGRSYELALDKPPSARRFPLPQDTGHACSLRLEAGRSGELTVAVRVREGVELGRLEARLGDASGFSERRTLRKGRASFPASPTLAPRYLYVTQGERALLRAPVLLGREQPFGVRVSVVRGQVALPGRPLTLEVETTWLGQPISTEVALSVSHGADSSELSDFAARALFQPLVHRGLVLGGEDLLTEARTRGARVEAFLLARAGYAYPPAGLPLGPKGTPPADAGARALAPELAPRPALEVAEPATKRRLGPLDRALRRAPFTRAESPRAACEPQATRRLSAKRLAAAPGLGKLAKRLPQEEKIGWSQADTRGSLCWQPRLRTDAEGRARITLRLGHELAPLRVVAQGFARGAAGVGLARIQPSSEASLRAEFPQALAPGDVVELWVEVEALDGREREPYSLALVVPPCLESLDRIALSKDPRRDSPRTKFRLRARATCAGAELKLLLRRGAFDEVHTRTFSVTPANPVVAFARSGITSARTTLQISLPEGALPGSARAEALVSPSGLSSAVEGLESLLREPHGCFEQTTSSNYPNLLLLEALRSQGSDAATLERAFDLAVQGYERISTFQHPDGGFSLWGPEQSEAPQAHYTAMGAAQLARYAALNNGQGSHRLARALSWLAAHRGQLATREALFVAFSLADAGRLDAVDPRAPSLEAKTPYERALLANLVCSLPEHDAARRRLPGLLDALILDQGDAAALEGSGAGVMGSVGRALSVAFNALSAVALRRGGRPEAATRALNWVVDARRPRGGWAGTQATALAVRALAEGASARGPERAIPVTLTADQASTRGLVVEGRQAPLALGLALPESAPGSYLQVGLSHGGQRELPYTLRCSYQVAEASDAPDAPYALRLRGPAALSVGGTERVEVRIERLRAAPLGQVVLRLALPGGLRVSSEGVAALSQAQRVEERGGELTFYWEEASRVPSSFALQVTGVAQGHFQAGVSSIYPYYAPERCAWARGRDLRVVGVGELIPSGAGGPAQPARQATQPR